MSAVPAFPDDAVSIAGAPDAPPVPERLSDTGLTADFLRDLILKVLYVQGSQTGLELARFIRLPFALLDDQLLPLQHRRFLEVRGTTGPNRASYIFDIGGEGRDRAKEALEASQYIGPAPVTLDQYREWTAIQSIRHARINRQTLRSALSHLVLHEDIFGILGPAVNSSKSIFLYGHPGNGKTAIAEAVSHMMGGSLYIPYAVQVEGQIMLVHDPVHHEAIDSADGDSADGDPEDGDSTGGDQSDGLWETGGEYDRRFALVRRPVVMTGGELTLDQLDLRFDPFAKLYQAPFQVKANGGVLIVDDFGRQRVPPRDLLNRWIVPLEKRVDFLTLHTGGKFPIPFDCLLIFATNLAPADLVEEAFLRRIHYKIPVGDPTRAGYEEIFRRNCEEVGVVYDPSAVRQIYRDFYQVMDIPPRASHPRDIMGHICDLAKFLEVTPRLAPELVEMACRSYFLNKIESH
jgi:predicted ATPase with chaperone activity